MSAHDLAGIPCPVCLKRFDTAEAVKAHQRAKRHKQFDSPDEMAMRRYHDDKLKPPATTPGGEEVGR